ncbi:MAG TPA: tryptophan synthase subunit alpha [Phycisphaerae bacterium]|nr:tryptophan synthase subunit alpha [Phycisphaerae bacterium]HRY68998.1 tryptophan synthase subunit alpha [Phycisphaerae bacterium]HSA26028.1 tryptophan synthase subunit alpha [Phycisphaerae bacterium]
MSESSNRIDAAFARLAAAGKKGLLPYVTAGLPDLHTTERVLEALADTGVTAVELGFPYSDSIADGPIIQSSFTRVLDTGIRVKDILEMVKQFRRRRELPLLAMLSYSIVYRIGLQRFLRMAADGGIDGLIVPDLSLEEAPQVAARIAEAGLRLPMLVSPASSLDRKKRLAELSTGFVYYMSVTGITGERDKLPPELVANVRELRMSSGRPVVVGFGISKAEQVRLVCSEADGVIIGSALVRRMMEAQDSGAGTDGIAQTAAMAAREWMGGLPEPK